MKYAAFLIGVLALIGFGYVMGGIDARIERDEARNNYSAALAAATAARDAADARSRGIEKSWSASVKAVGDTYEGIIANEKALADRTIHNLRTDNVRLRVLTAAAAGRRELPGPAACAAVDHGQAEQTLAGSVAARLAGRYADYNAAVDQLSACQAILETERRPQ